MKPVPPAFVPLLFGVVSLASCRERRPPIDYTIPAGIPRAVAAAANVRPDLERDLKARGLRFGDPVFIRAFKRERKLELFVRNRGTGKFEMFRSYAIAAESGGQGPKLAEGDWQVPEGFYSVPLPAMKPDSAFHLAFNIGYPNEYDRAHGRTGSYIMVHGSNVSAGCLAMTDEKIEEIYTLCDAALRRGQPVFRVHIFPFRMTAEAMKAEAGNPNLVFWQNLKEGYDVFEKSGVPPEVSVAAGRYVFQ
jgi:murein L,D-transpeptidase YafK